MILGHTADGILKSLERFGCVLQASASSLRAISASFKSVNFLGVILAVGHRHIVFILIVWV
jgi:hypothetical protein